MNVVSRAIWQISGGMVSRLCVGPNPFSGRQRGGSDRRDPQLSLGIRGVGTAGMPQKSTVSKRMKWYTL